MNSYRALAARYDVLTADVDYPGLLGYLEKLFRRAGRPIRTVLDLACGTGSLTWLLAARGYETIGVDQSAEMLAEADAKTGAGVKPLFLCQPMERLDLYGDVDACVCCLDSVNYVTRPASLARAFQRVHTFLAPGGLFVLDARTPQFYAAMNGQAFADETEDTVCHWQSVYSEKRGIATFAIDLFQREGALWRREQEEHIQYAYTMETLTQLLRQAGFHRVTQHGDRKLRRPNETDSRIFFTAVKAP